MEIRAADSQLPARGPGDYFTGDVQIQRMHSAPEPARVDLAKVTFAPGARTAWHTHPLGQTLLITEGNGWAQKWGGKIEEFNEGDVVWFPPGEKHWHGATSTSAMTHIAIQERLEGSAVEWLEHVTDEQYQP